MSSRQQRSRQRGRYGQDRLSKKVGGVNVNLQKMVKLPSGKVVIIPPHKHPDILTDMFAFEAKYESRIPKYISKRMVQAEANCPNGFIPVLVIRDKERGKYYYIMEEENWQDLHG